jgi:hypothetical protein
MPVDSRRLIEQWNAYAGWIWALAKDDREGAVLKPLAGNCELALVLIRAAAGSDSHEERKLGASLAGYVATPPPDLLRTLLAWERKRDAALPAQSYEKLACQSVVEDIVFSATRWCWADATRQAGLAVLREVVNDTLGGQYWNTASYAMVSLIRHGAEDAEELLGRFRKFAHSPPPAADANRPDTTQERSFAHALAAGDEKARNVIDNLLRDRDQASDEIGSHPEVLGVVAAFMQAAESQSPPN